MAYTFPIAPTAWGSAAHEIDLAVLLADTAAQDRNTIALRKFAPRAEELAAQAGHPLYQAIADRARGVMHRLAGDGERAEGLLRESLSRFAELKARWQIGRTWFELGELHWTRRDLPSAGEDYTRALAEFESLSARPDAERVRAALVALDSIP